MSRRVEITTCIECPYMTRKRVDEVPVTMPFCNKLNHFIAVQVEAGVDSNCPLEEIDNSTNKDDHRLAIKHIYQILQKKGINNDTLHDANTYFNQYLKDLQK